MNENNTDTELLPTEQQEIITSAALSEEAGAAVTAPSPRKKFPTAAVVSAVLACAAVVGGLFAAKSFFAPKPEKIVLEAFEATVAQQQNLTDEIYETIPAAKRLLKPSEAAPSETAFDLTLRSVEGIDYAQLVSAMIADSGISGTVLTDPDSGSSLADITVALKRKPLINAQLYLSPELVTAAVPTFSDKIISAAPQNFAADYKNSIFNKTTPMSDDELKMMQQLITGELEYIKALGSISYQKLVDDITAIIKKPLETAVFGYDKANGRYIVTLDGEAVKSAVCEYYRYLYIDSDIAPAMEKLLMPLFTASQMAKEDYNSTMDGILAELQENIPPLETAISLEIDKGLIKTANIVAAPTEQIDGNSVFNSPFTADIVFNENNSSVNMVFNINNPVDGTEMKMTVNADGLFADNLYTLNVKVDAESDGSVVTVPLVITIAAEEDYSIDFGFDTTMSDRNVKVDFSADGTASLEEDFFTVELPSSRIYYAVSADNLNTSGALVFDYRQSNTPLTERIAPPENHLSIFSFNEQTLQQLIDEYSAGAQSLAGKLMSAFM